MIPKIKRTITSIFPVDKQRTGECTGCGDCCKLPFRCAFLTETDDGEYRCSIYKIRPLNCRKFPRSRDQWSQVKENCGFSFPEEDIKVKTENSKA